MGDARERALDARYIATARRVEAAGIASIARAEYVLMSVWYAVGVIAPAAPAGGFAVYAATGMPLAELSDALCAISAFPAARVVERLRAVVVEEERRWRTDAAGAVAASALEAEFRAELPMITAALVAYVERELPAAG
jgi:hypothetical protein